eukprot:6994749-Prymnesium_polylepis.1
MTRWTHAALARTACYDLYPDSEAEAARRGVPMNAQTLFNGFLDGVIEASDPRLAALPAGMRAQVDRIAAAEADHKDKFQVIEQRRQAVLAETGMGFEGSLSIVYGSKPSVLVINGVSMTDNAWFYERLCGISSEDHSFRQTEEERNAAAVTWSGVHLTKLSFGFAEDAALVRQCQEAI